VIFFSKIKCLSNYTVVGKKSIEPIQTAEKNYPLYTKRQCPWRTE